MLLEALILASELCCEAMITAFVAATIHRGHVMCGRAGEPVRLGGRAEPSAEKPEETMAITRKIEDRALDAEERDLVAKSHHPALQDLSDEDLSQLVKLVRERRDKAKTQANQRRREMRGKAAPKGATPSRSDDGSKTKLAVLAMAVRRLNSELERRRRMRARIR